MPKSHAIEEVIKYRMDGKLFDSEEKAIQNREDMIGEVIDKLNTYVVLDPREKLAILEWLKDNRDELHHLLNY